MLNPFDDYPIHQTAAPIAQPGSGDLNAYDRYFFNGYEPESGTVFGIALGVYPNRRVIDGAFSVLRDGVQRSVFASGLAPLERDRTEVGPVSIEVVEPLRRHRIRVAAAAQGIEAELEMTARTAAVEEPHFVLRQGTRVVMDYTRLTQFGTWRGHVLVEGTRLEVDGWRGCRDRSWGIRPVGERGGGAPAPAPQFFWLWAPVQFDDACVHVDVQEYADGARWHEYGVEVPLLRGEHDPAWSADGSVTAHRVDHRIAWTPGTRRAASAELVLSTPAGETDAVRLEPIAVFQMLGLGYLHPEWGHGAWKGETAVGADRWVVADLDPLLPQHVHVQQLCRAEWRGRTGFGVLEQLVIGPHEPSGFGSLFDGAA